MFDPHIYTKFTNLIKVNKERYYELKEKLTTPSPEIEQYIEMKRFLESDEITANLQQIGNEIRLCRKLNQFEENLMKSDSKLINTEYLESLSWVNELTFHKEAALKRTQEDLPRFREELGRIAKKLQQDFTFTRASIKDFDEFIDDKDAELYYDKASAIDSALDSYLERIANINHKLEILGEKKNHLIEKDILREKASFERYLSLWKFIATSWNVDHAQWRKEYLHKIDKDDMENVINNGSALLSKLQDSFRENELMLKLVRNKNDEVRKFKVVLDVVKILKNPNFKDRHWDELFNDIRESDKNDSLGLREGRPDISKLTLGQLMIANITSHLKLLMNIISRATTEAETEKKIKEINYRIESFTIKPTVFDLDNSGLSIIASIKSIISKLNVSLSECLNMLADPNNPEEFTRELNSLVKLLSFICSVLSSIHSLQGKLIRVSPIFKFKELEKFLTKKETVSQFSYVREEFKKIMYSIEEKQMKLFLDIMKTEDEDEKIKELENKLKDLNTTATNIQLNLKTFFKMIRIQSPRYFYTTDEQMMTLCSLIKFPKSLMGFVTYLFKGISAINVNKNTSLADIECLELNSVVTKAGEIIEFSESIKVDMSSQAQMPLITIVSNLEQVIARQINLEKNRQLPILANLNFNFISIFNHWQEKFINYQLLCLSTQILFDFEITMLILAFNQAKDIGKGQNALKNLLTGFKEKMLDRINSFVVSPISVLKGNKMRNPQAVQNLNHFVQLVMGFVVILDFLIVNEVFDTQDFNFQIIPKYSVVFSKTQKVYQHNESQVSFDEVSSKIEAELNARSDNSKVSGHASTSNILKDYFNSANSKLVLTMMNQTIAYKYELTHPNRNIIVWPLFEKSIFSMFSALSTTPFLILKGFSNQGKLETARAIVDKVAANYYECDLAFTSYDAPTVSFFIYGMISGGYWMTFKNCEKANLEILSILASLAEEVSHSITAKKASINFHGEEILVKGGHALMCTFNLRDESCISKFEGLGNNITDQFRVINMNIPDYSSIISSLVSLVFDNEDEKHQWTYKLLMFCKMFKVMETIEVGVNLNQSQGIKYTHLKGDENSLVKGTWRIENKSQNKPADLTLRELVRLLTISLIKYFGSLDLYYESFKESYGAEHKNMIENLKITSDREHMFSIILKKEIMNWLLIFEPYSDKQRTYSDLLDKVFTFNSGKHVIEYKESRMAPPKEVLKAVALFKTVFPYPKANLPENDEKIERFVSYMLESVLNRDQVRQFIVLGDPNTQKSTLIKLVSFIEGELKNLRTPQYWLNLECLSREDIFGEKSYHGILREILLLTNNINLEDKNTSNTIKLNHLFESNNELFVQYSDPDTKSKKPLDKQSSWIVFDSNSSKNNDYFFSKVNYLMSIFGNLYEEKEVNQFIGFSNKLKVIYEMSSIALLEPRHVSNASLIFINEGLLTLEDRISQWLSLLTKQHAYFFKMMASKVENVLTGFILPLIEHYTSKQAEGDRLYKLSSISILNNFLTYFEIFLNEFRKFHIAQALAEARLNPESFLAERKVRLNAANKNSKLPSEQFSYGAGMRMAQQAGGLSMITSVRKGKAADNKVDDDQVAHLTSKEEIDEFEKRKIEGLALFCFVGAIYPILFSRKPTNLVVTVDKFVSTYCTKNNISKLKFGDGIFKLINDKKIGGQSFDLSKYLYEFSVGKWIPWETYKFPNKVEISSSFSENNFTKTELNRLNCQNSQAYYSARNPNNDEIFTFLYPVEKTIVRTSNVNHMRYMLDIFMNYKRHTLLMSDHQQGKSTFLGHMYIRDLVEQRELITFNFALQHNITPKVIQTQIEDNLLKGGENLVHPPQNKRVIIWIDDLQMSSNMEKPESLVRNLQVQQGWFSSNRKNFIKIKDCQFLMTFSLTEYNPECSSQSINALNSDVLSKCVLLKTHLLSYKDLNSVFFEQVKSYLSPSPDNKKEKLAAKLFHQLSKVVYFNQDKLRNLSVSQGLNLNLEAFCQLTKTLGLIEWEVVSENPENVLFVWYHTMINFFSSDLDFQALEFQTIVEEKRSKMLKMIHTPRKSSMFESGTRQRLSIKVNLHLVEMIKGRNSLAADDSGDEKPEEGDGKKKRSSSITTGALDVKKTQIPQMDLIIEESDAEHMSDTESKDSQSIESNSKEKKNDDDDGQRPPSIAVSSAKTDHDEKQDSVSVKDSNESKQNKQEEVTNNKEEHMINEKIDEDKEEVLESGKAFSKSSSSFDDDGDMTPREGRLRSQLRTSTDPTGLQSEISEIRNSLNIKPAKSNANKQQEMPKPSTFNTCSLLTVDKNQRGMQGSRAELHPEMNQTSQRSIGRGSKKSKSPKSSVGSRSSSNSSSKSSKRSKSKKSDDDNSSSQMDDFSEELFDNEDILMEEFKINNDMPVSDYFKRFIHYTMNFKMPKNMSVQETLKRVCFEKKHIFDEVLIRELKDLREAKDEAEDHTFIVADKKDEKEIMEFMKTTLTGFIKIHPEALFALKLDGGNFPLLIKHFSMLAMSIMTEFQQIYLSSIKSLLYCKTLINYVCTSIGCTADYVDLLGSKTIRQADEKLGKIDAYEQILDLLLMCFPDIWKLKKRIIVVNIPNSAILEEHQPLLDKVLDLISSIILNSDMLNHHLGERLKEMIEMPKRDKMYVHYTEFDIKFTIRNRMQAYLTFIILNDSTEDYTEKIKIENSGVRNLEFYAYMNERYPKLAGKLSKVVINGVKCLEPEDTPQFYTPPLPFEEIEITPMIAKCLNAELNYLRCVDKDREHFSLVKPYNENVILVNVVRYLFRMKFVYLESDVDIAECNRDKTQICQRVELRREVVQLEIKEIDNQIEAKNKEKIQVEAKQGELANKKSEWVEKKKNLEETMGKLENNAAELAKEEKMYMELKSSMFETLRAVKDYKEKEVQSGVFANNFTKGKMFAIYSVLFAELTGTAEIMENKVQLEDLNKISEATLQKDNYFEYTTKFEETLKNFQQGFVDTLASLSSEKIQEKTINSISKVLENLSTSTSSGASFNSMQRVIMKLFDTSIETIKLEHAKAKREFETLKINETNSLLKAQIDKADDFLNLIEEGIKDLPGLLEKIEERKQLLMKKREVAENNIKTLIQIVEKLNKYQQEFTVASQPLLNPAIKRDSLIDLLACYIVIFNKYPFQIKKKLLYVAIQNTELSKDLFEDIPLYEMMSTDSLMTDTMRTKIPCNTNFLTNLSIIDFLQEDQLVLYPLVVDKGKMFMKWHQTKFSKNAFYDRYVVTANSLDHIENALRTGSMYVAIDPREELMTLIEPIIDWQFRRFTENILTAYNTNMEISDSINYFGKKIQVAKGFFLCIVLEILPVEEIDQNVMSKMLIMDNSILNEGLFCETIADELAMNLENNTRGFFVSEYMNKSIQQSIIDKYKKLINNAKTFDFLKNSFDDYRFKQLLTDLDSFEILLEKFKEEKEERKRALVVYQDSQKSLYSLKILTLDDENEFRFMNYPFAFKVNGFLKMMSKFMACSNRLWIYFLGLEKMKKFVGSGFTISYDILAHLLKFTISISDIKVTSADIEKNSETFIALFSQVEQRAYQALCSMVPGSLHYVFNLILGVLLLKKRSSKKVEFTQHLSLFLLSEKILSRPDLPTLVSSGLKDIFTEKMEIIKDYFNDKEDFLPQYLFSDILAVDKVHEELKIGSKEADAKIEEYNIITIAQHNEPSLTQQNDIQKSELSVTADQVSKEVTSLDMKEGLLYFNEQARREISLQSFKESSNFVHQESTI